MHGYLKSSGHPSYIVCEPACSPACPENAYCSAPGLCSCKAGYNKSDEGLCEPICDSKCREHSHCSSPNRCSCDEGYRNDPNVAHNDTDLMCQPECKPECPSNAICSEPNKCTCMENYIMVDSQCKAICDPECPENSYCKTPNQCDCLEGYEWGKLEDNSTECIAKCKEDCPQNGFCSRPNICDCSTGYIMSNNNTCEPVCESECPTNSRCSEPDLCSCLKGYEMVDHKCQAICEKPCPPYSECIVPNKCQCFAGYQMKMSSIHTIYCEPQCQTNCSTFGKCVQPNKCECLPGYEMNEMEECKPVCSHGCMNGLCYQPEICICNPGYLMGPHNQCEPVCSLPCQNGSCVEPEICQCTKGYNIKNGTVNICEPQCIPECINGICVDANICICHDNYEPLDLEQVGFNHNHCQRSKSTTVQVYNRESETTPNMASTFPSTTAEQSEQSSTEAVPILENIMQSSTSPLLEDLQKCLTLCQCWEEYDEFGSFSNMRRCLLPCEDRHGRPCLNVSICQCEPTKPQLICQSEDDSDEEDFVYICKIPHPKVTTEIPATVTEPIELKSTAKSNNGSTNVWIILVSVVGACGLTAIGYLVYKKCIQHQDS